MQRAVSHLDGRESGGAVEPIILARTLLRAQTDARLVQLAAEGHERPFEVIVERYRRPLERYCRRLLAPAMAEDVVQQVFLAAWLALRDGTQVRCLHGWLYRIAYNAALAAAHRPEFDYAQLRDSDRCADAADCVLERRATVREALAALATLPDRQREALLRIAVESRSPAEVADEFGLSRNALRQLVFRARSTLRAGAVAVAPSHLVAWVASLGQAGTGAVTTTTSGALLKVGAAALAAGAVGVSTAELVERPDRVPANPAAATARAAAGASGIAHDSVAPTARVESMALLRRDDRPGRRETAPRSGKGESGSERGAAPSRGVVPGDSERPGDQGQDDGSQEPKPDEDPGNADVTLDTDSDPDALARHASSDDESPDPDVQSSAESPSDDESPDPETDASESDEPGPEASTAEADDQPQAGASGP
jgi:RNA polymerase sigma factor (sigma-70 family)